MYYAIGVLRLFWLKSSPWYVLLFLCLFTLVCGYHFHLISKAAEQAKASPALVAKDPSTSTNKKEEEDLAKGKETFFHPQVAIEKCIWRGLKKTCTLTLFTLHKSLFTLDYYFAHVQQCLRTLEGKHMISHICLFCVQLLSSHWRSNVSSRRPPCRAFTQAPPACSPHTSPTAGRSAPSTTSRPLRTMSWLSSQEKSSLSWMIGEFLHAQIIGR